MLKSYKQFIKKWLLKGRSLLIATLGQKLLNLLLFTCRFHIEGLEQFCELASKEKCLLMLWHNRLALVPFILSHYTPPFPYAAFVSGSRDGDMLEAIIRTYKNGHIIRVSHQARYQALRELIRQVEERQHVVIITPDGPRGPCYALKPGIAITALETQSYVIPLNWEAKHYWELNTWDRLRLPKPLTTIRVSFGTPIRFDGHPLPSLEQAQEILTGTLPSPVTITL